MIFSQEWDCPAQEVQYPLVFPLSEYQFEPVHEKFLLDISERNRRHKEKSVDIRIPDFPDDCNLAEEFELIRFFQKNQFEDEYAGSYFAWSFSDIYRDGVPFMSVEPSHGHQLIDRMREFWKTKWQAELPEWVSEICDLSKLFIPRAKWRMVKEGKGTVFNTGKKGPLRFIGLRGASSEIMPEKSTILVLRDQDNVYMVCAYNNFFTDDLTDEQKDSYMKNLLLKGQLRYVFLGTFKLDDVYQAQIYRFTPGGIFEWNSPPKKKHVDTFEPTGEIFYFDKDGNPELFVSFKEGKLLGPQITWNPDGTIKEYKNIDEPGEDNCERYWVEFGYVDKFNPP